MLGRSLNSNNQPFQGSVFGKHHSYWCRIVLVSDQIFPKVEPNGTFTFSLFKVIYSRSYFYISCLKHLHRKHHFNKPITNQDTSWGRHMFSPRELSLWMNVKFCTTKSQHLQRKCWFPGIISPVEAQVPLADQVCGVASLAEPLGQGVHVWRQTARLAGSDDGVLQSRVDLISARGKPCYRSEPDYPLAVLLGSYLLCTAKSIIRLFRAVMSRTLMFFVSKHKALSWPNDDNVL